MLPFEAVEAKATRRAFEMPRMRLAIGLAGRAQLVRDLSTLINADIAVDQALRILGDSAGSRSVAAIVGRSTKGVAAGRSLSLALRDAAANFATMSSR